MKSKNLILYFIICCCNYIQSEILNETLNYEKIEKVNNVEFIHRKKVINGIKEETWLVNNKEVSKDEFKNSILDSKKNELNSELSKEEDLKIQEEQFKKELKINALKKILLIKLKEVEDELKKIKELENYNLTSYFIFSPETFDSLQNLKFLENELISEIKKYLTQAMSAFSIEDINNYIEKINNYPNQLKKLFNETLNNSIKLCDDTKLLRKLLELL